MRALFSGIFKFFDGGHRAWSICMMILYSLKSWATCSKRDVSSRYSYRVKSVTSPWLFQDTQGYKQPWTNAPLVWPRGVDPMEDTMISLEYGCSHKPSLTLDAKKNGFLVSPFFLDNSFHSHGKFLKASWRGRALWRWSCRKTTFREWWRFKSR